MDRLAVAEARMLFFHRVLLDQIRTSPGLLERAKARLSGAADDQWARLLTGSVDAMEAAVLEDSPAGGLLRSRSPLMAALTEAERNALWQRVGLQQVVAYAQAACADLGLSAAEEVAVLGDGAASWHERAPASLTGTQLEPLKQIIAIQRALAVMEPEQQARRDWLRRVHPDFAVAPIDILVNGGGEVLQHGLAEMVRPRLASEDLPSH